MSDEFIFRKNDNIGQPAAEFDDEFLDECFVNTGDFDELASPQSCKIIIVGRTGSGKSALFRMLQARHQENVIVINPELLALDEVAECNMLRFVAELNANVEPVLKLLWRHVITTEGLRFYYKSRCNREPDKTIKSWIVGLFSRTPDEQRRIQDAIAKLEKWGEGFWGRTGDRIVEVASKIENQLSSELQGSFKVLGLGEINAKFGAVKSLTEEQKTELKNAAQTAISRTQVRGVAEATELLDQLFADRTKCCYILIDRLDENWVDDTLRLRLIKALIETASEFIKVPGLKVIVALRRDLLDRVYKSARHAGHQEEKSGGLLLPLSWCQTDIIQVLDRRVQKLVRRRYTKQVVKYHDLLPEKYAKMPIERFVFEIAPRPRDVIALFNSCIYFAEGSSQISKKQFAKALGDYSRGRVKALVDEWATELPEIKPFVQLFPAGKASGRVGEISREQIINIEIQVVSNQKWSGTSLCAAANRLNPSSGDWEIFRAEVIYLLFKVGFLGLKASPNLPLCWRNDATQVVSFAEITDSTRFQLHPSLHQALGVSVDSSLN